MNAFKLCFTFVCMITCNRLLLTDLMHYYCTGPGGYSDVLPRSNRVRDGIPINMRVPAVTISLH